MVNLNDIFSGRYCGQPYIIAEAGVNHNGSLKMAFELIDRAAEAGADCVKFQAFTAGELVTRDAQKASYQHDPSQPQQSQLEMLEKLELNSDDFALLSEYCQKRDIDFMVTPFSMDWAQKLLDYGVKCFKVSSGHLTALDFLRDLSSLQLPIILSTGMSTMDEVAAAIDSIVSLGRKIAILHCVSLYPTPLEKVNLRAISTLRKEFHLPVGFSDHTVETITGAFACAAGAVILEKHMTLDKSLPGPDHAASLSPDEFSDYVRQVRSVSVIMGDGIKQPDKEEYEIRNVARLSLSSACDIMPGTVITDRMLMAKRPGTGISPADKHKILGQKAKRHIEKGELISISDIQM